MVVCKHCGAEIEEDLEYCPNCGQSKSNTKGKEVSYDDFFESEDGTENDYDILDGSDDFDFDALLSKEFSRANSLSQEIQETPIVNMEDISEVADLTEVVETVAAEDTAEELDLKQIESLDTLDFVLPDGTPADGMNFMLSELDDLSVQNIPLDNMTTPEVASTPTPSIENTGAIDSELVNELNFVELDDLLQDLAEVEQKEKAESNMDSSLGAMLAGSLEDEPEKKKKKKKKQKQNKQPFFQRIFGNVPIDPSKIKPEPTKEEIAEAKQKKAEEKKQAADAKKVAKEQQKEAKKQEKERKAQEKALEKEAQKAKKLEEAKQILEEVQETRINRVGTTVVFVLFAICAVGIAFGSDFFSYSVSVNNAEKSFNLALDNDVSYYNDAYEQIYGLEVKPEDQELNDKIMTVMFVNKELNSYNNYMVLEEYESALHSLLQGIYRYGKYYENAIPLGIDRDLDFVRRQILKELENTFHVSEDEAEVLRSQLEQAMGSEEASKEYSLTIYEIVRERKLTKE